MENRGVESLRPNAGDQQVHTHPYALGYSIVMKCFWLFAI
jgi:hypothetical protein